MTFLPPDYNIPKSCKSYDYKPKVLELTARAIGDEFVGYKIVELLKFLGFTDSAIDYPNSKWKTILSAFKYAKNEYNEAHITIENIISEFLDPLNHDLNDEKVKKLVEKVRKILKYDDLIIVKNKDRYIVYNKEDFEHESEIDEQELWQEHYSNHEEEMEEEKKKTKNRQLDLDILIVNKKKIREIKEYHQAYMDLLEVFCSNSSQPNDDLNSHYLFLKKHIQKLIDELHLNGTIQVYIPFKNDLYFAEKEWGQDASKGPISWDKIRPELYSVHSWISQRCNAVENHEQQSDDEKKLGKINETIGKYRTQKLQTKNETTRIEILHEYKKSDDSTLYITKKDDDFYYKGLHILATKKNNDYYKVFCALYAKLPEGGEIPYKDLIAEIKSRMQDQRNKTDDEMRKFIQGNLTDKGNGFVRYAKIPETEDNGKPLISIIRGSGVLFNNKTG